MKGKKEGMEREADIDLLKGGGRGRGFLGRKKVLVLWFGK